MIPNCKLMPAWSEFMDQRNVVLNNTLLLLTCTSATLFFVNDLHLQKSEDHSRRLNGLLRLNANSIMID